MKDHSQIYLSPEDLLQLISLGPLTSVDLILRNSDGHILLGKRHNEPAKGSWFVPGGKTLKNERIADALQRTLERELGLGHLAKSARFINFYQHLYAENFAEIDGLSTHYIVLAHLIDLPDGTPLKSDDQHEDLRWFSLDELAQHPEVHPYTKDYLPVLQP